MFSFFGKASASNNYSIIATTIRGFKVSLNKDRSKKYGIAAESLEKLRSKVKAKFKLETFDLFLSDGSLLEDDDYFLSLPGQSLIVVAEPGEEVKTDLQLIIESFRRVNHDILRSRDLIHDYVRNDKNCDVLKTLSRMQNEVEEKITLTTREADPDWFVGLEKLKTKEDVMRRKGQDRIKGYFYKTKDELTKSAIYRTKIEGRKIIDDLLTDFFLFLNGVDYFSCIFDRSFSTKFVHDVDDETDASNADPLAKPKRRRIDSETKAKVGESDLFKKFQVALCNDSGNFRCHGSWNARTCTYEHMINPYSSRESAVLFQIYNLDHQIEISRSIFPSILKSVTEVVEGARCAIHSSKKAIGISVFTYFREIFTIDNLKLVHIVCHDKGTHDELKSKGRVVCENCVEFKNIRKLKLKLT